LAKKVSAEVESLLQPVADEMGLYLVDVETVREDDGLFLRIYIDKDKTGVDLDACEAFHRRIIPLLENVEYDYLEVSSPGDRPLKKPADFLRMAGKDVEVRLYAPHDGKKRIIGKLISGDKESIVLEERRGELVFPRKNVALVKPYFRP